MQSWSGQSLRQLVAACWLMMCVLMLNNFAQIDLLQGMSKGWSLVYGSLGALCFGIVVCFWYRHCAGTGASGQPNGSAHRRERTPSVKPTKSCLKNKAASEMEAAVRCVVTRPLQMHSIAPGALAINLILKVLQIWMFGIRPLPHLQPRFCFIF